MLKHNVKQHIRAERKGNLRVTSVSGLRLLAFMRRRVPPMTQCPSSIAGSRCPGDAARAGRTLGRGALAGARGPAGTALVPMTSLPAALRHPLDGDPPPSPVVNVGVNLPPPASLVFRTLRRALTMNMNAHNRPFASARYSHALCARSKLFPMMRHKDADHAISKTRGLEMKRGSTIGPDTLNHQWARRHQVWMAALFSLYVR